MPNNNRNKQNQPPTGEGKKQSPYSGEEHKADKRAEVAQAQRNHPEGDYGAIARDEGSSQGIVQRKDNPNRQKAGR
jgi:bifunctional N-acetylglucosamine-1-phosphate-uridyltransferase/glucosamine-1-phosphate-acetyltransferase GlmU-like protein